MRSRAALLAVLVLSASVLLAGAASGDAPTASASKVVAKKGGKLKLVDSEYGRAIMNGKGRALYLFDKETTSTPDCYGECAVAWPPLLTTGKPVAGKGVDPKRVGTTLRSDGTRQVTYRGHPLYFYEHDRPGFIFCQDVFEFGGTWLLVNGRGNAIR